MRIVAVRELTLYLKELLSSDYLLQDVWVRGEVTNYTQSSLGHRYFSLKDETAQLNCVLFRTSGWSVPALRNGMAVIAHGRLTIYEQRGLYQLNIDAVEDAGIGELHLRFEELKGRLAAEGLFAEERKRALPPCPAVIGVVTSPAAAALRDILRTLRLRFPLARVILAPAMVQGEGAAEQVAAAIAALNAQGESEVIVVARGGGSLEELWAFNEEIVARAIAGSRVPICTGIGHETDFTIADFVADYRASTPTAAASAVVPDLAGWREALDETRRELDAAVGRRLMGERERAAELLRRLERGAPAHVIANGRQRADDALSRLETALRHTLELRREHLRGDALRLHALSPLLTIARGFAIVRRASDGPPITSVAQVKPGQALAIRVADGEFAAVAGPRLAAPPAEHPPAERARSPQPLQPVLIPTDAAIALREDAPDDH
ncbi:MAG: exodeoxyribonuclease VII large subunit [Ktedonobacterales bacterium]